MNNVYLVAIAAAFAIVIERVAPNVTNPRISGWWPRVAAFNAVQAVVAYCGSVTWDRWMAGHTLIALDHWAFWSQVVAGYLLITFVYYWWHRARHEIPILWRGLHQLHHSPRRLEVLMSFYKHPLEIIVNGLLSSFLVIVALGLEPAAVAGVIALTGLAELFYHWNVRTPVWLGYLIQRPESHRIHHQRGRHTHNFSDLPLWDMLFGTFRNARGSAVTCGFAKQRELRVAAMLTGQDVNKESSS